MHRPPSESPWPVAYVELLRRCHLRVLELTRSLERQSGACGQHAVELWRSLFVDIDGTVAQAAVRSIPVVDGRPPLALGGQLRRIVANTRPPECWGDIGGALRAAHLEAQRLVEGLVFSPVVVWNEALVARLATARLARVWSLALEPPTRIEVAVRRVERRWRIAGIRVHGGFEELWSCWRGLPLRQLAPLSVTCGAVPMRWQLSSPLVEAVPQVLDGSESPRFTAERQAACSGWREDVRELFEVIPRDPFARSVCGRRSMP